MDPVSEQTEPKAKLLVPFDAPQRQRPIHKDLPDFKVPEGDLATYQYNPLTCEPWTTAELEDENLKRLQAHYGNAEEAQIQAINVLKARLEEFEQRRREIDREMEEAEKTRALERRIFEKQSKGSKDVA